MIERISTWEQALADYLASVADAEFTWGELDCALFAANAVLAMTGHDIAAPFRGKYSTAAGSARALKRYGAGTLEATFDTLLPVKPIGYARRGDVVMHDGGVGVCVGSHALFVGREGEREGLVRVPRAEWVRAWGVGE
ncbi:DUF6950 family protein [Sphingobium sp. BS19]|uniref:DUF6950 family protein n=1 Tax=Sphingobium sp. BS19 TaxID=3018973 RepID=UPI0022EDD81B|nr:hypothetical protein [Sphingobium sp. BS19]GLI99113.1 hypothetical protein Sbs19_29310 [Sphingobium sp. BS19]